MKILRSFEEIRKELRRRAKEIIPNYDENYSQTINYIIDLLAYVAMYQAFHLDAVMNEMFLETAIFPANVDRIIKGMGYTRRKKSPAAGTVRIWLDHTKFKMQEGGKVKYYNPFISDILIPKGTVILTSSGIRFITTKDAVIRATDITTQSSEPFYFAVTEDGYIDIPVCQLEIVERTIGRFPEENVLPFTRMIVPISPEREVMLTYQHCDFYDETTVTVSVEGGVDYNLKVYSSTLEATPGEHNCVLERVNEKTYVRFGDGKFFGMDPAVYAGGTVKIHFLSTSGSVGNVPAHSVTRIERQFTGTTSTGVINVPLKVDNPAPFSGGDDGEDIETAKKNALIFLRTNRKAVTEDDIRYFAGEYMKSLGFSEYIMNVKPRYVYSGHDVDICVIGLNKTSDGRYVYQFLNETQKKELAEYLKSISPLTMRYFVRDGYPLHCAVQLRCVLKENANPDVASNEIYSALRNAITPYSLEFGKSFNVAILPTYVLSVPHLISAVVYPNVAVNNSVLTYERLLEEWRKPERDDLNFTANYDESIVLHILVMLYYPDENILQGKAREITTKSFSIDEDTEEITLDVGEEIVWNSVEVVTYVKNEGSGSSQRTFKDDEEGGYLRCVEEPSLVEESNIDYLRGSITLKIQREFDKSYPITVSYKRRKSTFVFTCDFGFDAYNYKVPDPFHKVCNL